MPRKARQVLDNSADTLIERLRWQLDRSQGWVDSADAKATTMIGLNAALIAGVLALDGETVSGYLDAGHLAVLLGSAFALSVSWSCLWACVCILPNLGKPKAGGSIFHFLDVNDMTIKEFTTASQGMTSLSEARALEHQAYTVSRIAATKFARMRFSVFGFLTGLMLGLIILFMHDFIFNGAAQ